MQTIAILRKIKEDIIRTEDKDISGFLKIIIVEKSIKGIILLLLSISVFPIFSDEFISFLEGIATRSHFLSNAQIFMRFLLRAEEVLDKKLFTFSLFFLVWGAIEIIESIGLAKKRRWAEYLAVVTTGVFIPVELYTVITQFTPEKSGLLLLNSVFVVYLIGSRNLFLIRH